jgi:hypothetical protein
MDTYKKGAFLHCCSSFIPTMSGPIKTIHKEAKKYKNRPYVQESGGCSHFPSNKVPPVIMKQWLTHHDEAFSYTKDQALIVTMFPVLWSIYEITEKDGIDYVLMYADRNHLEDVHGRRDSRIQPFKTSVLAEYGDFVASKTCGLTFDVKSQNSQFPSDDYVTPFLTVKKEITGMGYCGHQATKIFFRVNHGYESVCALEDACLNRDCAKYKCSCCKK